MAVDTSRDAVERLSSALTGLHTILVALMPPGMSSDQRQNFTEWLATFTGADATPRAFLARAEAAEARSDEAHRALIVEVKRTEAFRAENTDLTTQRDAATAERDRLAEALRKIIAQDWWDATERQGDEADTVDGRCAEIARAALASINKDPTDGE